MAQNNSESQYHYQVAKQLKNLKKKIPQGFIAPFTLYLLSCVSQPWGRPESVFFFTPRLLRLAFTLSPPFPQKSCFKNTSWVLPSAPYCRQAYNFSLEQLISSFFVKFQLRACVKQSWLFPRVCPLAREGGGRQKQG